MNPDPVTVTLEPTRPDDGVGVTVAGAAGRAEVNSGALPKLRPFPMAGSVKKERENVAIVARVATRTTETSTQAPARRSLTLGPPKVKRPCRILRTPSPDGTGRPGTAMGNAQRILP